MSSAVGQAPSGPFERTANPDGLESSPKLSGTHAGTLSPQSIISSRSQASFVGCMMAVSPPNVAKSVLVLWLSAIEAARVLA